MTICLICRHPDRELIDAAIVEGTSERVAAARFGLKKSTLHLHKARCVQPRIREAARNAIEQSGNVLLAKVDSLLDKVMAVVERCENRKRDPLLLKAVKDAVELLKFRMELTGDVRDPKKQPAASVSYNVSFVGGRPTTARSETIEPEPIAAIEGTEPTTP